LERINMGFALQWQAADLIRRQTVDGAMEYFSKRDFTDDKRKELAESGAAMPDGSFPIENESDLENAIHLAGHGSNPAAAKAHIKSRAKALGAESKLPDEWVSKTGAFRNPGRPLQLSVPTPKRTPGRPIFEGSNHAAKPTNGRPISKDGDAMGVDGGPTDSDGNAIEPNASPTDSSGNPMTSSGPSNGVYSHQMDKQHVGHTFRTVTPQNQISWTAAHKSGAVKGGFGTQGAAKQQLADMDKTASSNAATASRQGSEFDNKGNQVNDGPK
jgi:hypothetical protein